ncbi:Kynurenine formamidase, partial [Operophtera brumata]
MDESGPDSPVHSALLSVQETQNSSCKKPVAFDMPLCTVMCLTLLGLLTFSYVSSNNVNNELFSGQYEFIDLSHPFDNLTVYWPGVQRFEFTKKTEQFIGQNMSWYAANEFTAGEHGGTHLDAPYHFSSTGKHVGEIPLTNSKVNDDPNFVLYKHDLDYILNDNLGKPCVLIFKFGWTKYYNHTKYLGINEQDKTLNFP